MVKTFQPWYLLPHDSPHLHLFPRTIKHFEEIRLQMFFKLFKYSEKSSFNKPKYNYAKKIPNLCQTYCFHKY